LLLLALLSLPWLFVLPASWVLDLPFAMPWLAMDCKASVAAFNCTGDRGGVCPGDLGFLPTL